MGLVLTDIKTSFGAYIAQGQNAQKINNSFMRPESALLKVFKTVPTQNEIERMALTSHSRVAQAFKRKWSPTGDITFTPHEIRLFKHKLDVECYPDDLENSWLAFLAGEGIVRKDWPFVRWYIEKHLLPQYEQDLEMNERFAGIYAVPTDNNTAAAAGTAMNGLDNILGTLVDAGTITPITTGALSSTANTFVGQIETFVRAIDPKIRKEIEYVNVPMEKKDKWLQGMRSLYLGNWGALTEDEKYKVIDTDVRVNFVEAQDGSNVIWATVKDNAIRFVKRAPNRLPIEIEGEDRKVKLFTDHWEGLGFVVPNFVFVNDQTTAIA